MSDERGIVQGAASLHEIRTMLQELSLNSVRKVLPDRAILSACWASGLKWRERKIPPIVVVLHMVMTGLWPEKSFAASWQTFWGNLASHLPGAAGLSPGSGAVSKARSRLPLKVWDDLFAWLAGRAQDMAALAGDSWRGLRLVMIDGFTVSMPSTPELVEAFGRARCSQGLHRFPLARAVTMALANSMALIGYRLGRYDESETASAQEIQGLLRPGDLLIGDRRFAGAHYYAAYLARGIQFLTRAHQGLKLHRLPRLQLLGSADFITSLRLSPDHRRTHPEAPATVIVRMIQVEARVRGKRQLLWLVTSLLDAQLYPASEIAELYSRRWRIETLIEEIKIGLGADVLRSLTPEGIRKEFAARMLATNVMRTIILEAALQHGVDPLSISFRASVRTVLAFAPALGRAPLCHLPAVYHGMLQEIAAQLIPHRPGRNEPRCIRRERQRFPRLKIPRAEWRRLHAS